MKEHSDSKNKYTEEDIIKILEFLVDNIFVVFAGKVFQQIIGIPMGTNCAPLLDDIFLYSYKAEHIQSLLSAGKKQLASQLTSKIDIYDVLSINNPDFENVKYKRTDALSPWTNNHGQIYPPELEIKYTTESNTWKLLLGNTCFILGFALVNRYGRSTSHFHLRQTWRFRFPYYKFSVPE